MTYTEKPVAKWNTNDFHKYVSERHKELYGIDYAPFRGWGAEKGMLGRLIGTSRKPGTHDKELVKRFIDICLDEYKPNPNYPGISIGFMITYKQNVMQRLQAEALRESRSNNAAKQADNNNWDELAEWL